MVNVPTRFIDNKPWELCGLICAQHKQPTDCPQRTRWETPSFKVRWVHRQISLNYDTKVESTSRNKEALLKVEASWLLAGAVPASATMWRPAHKQLIYFAPTEQWGCQSHLSRWKQRVKRIVWMKFVCNEWKATTLEKYAVGRKATVPEKCLEARLYYQCKRKDWGPQFTRGVSP